MRNFFFNDLYFVKIAEENCEETTPKYLLVALTKSKSIHQNAAQKSILLFEFEMWQQRNTNEFSNLNICKLNSHLIFIYIYIYRYIFGTNT